MSLWTPQVSGCFIPHASPTALAIEGAKLVRRRREGDFTSIEQPQRGQRCLSPALDSRGAASPGGGGGFVGIRHFTAAIHGQIGELVGQRVFLAIVVLDLCLGKLLKKPASSS